MKTQQSRQGAEARIHLTAIGRNMVLGNLLAAQGQVASFITSYKPTANQLLWFGRINEAVKAWRLALSSNTR